MTIGITALLALTLNAQDNPILKDEIELRKELIINHLNGTIDIDDKSQKSVALMIDIFIQTLTKVGQNTVDANHLKSVYIEVVKNHILLLGNYLSEEDLNKYLSDIRPEESTSELCIVCQSSLKTDHDYCVFCGHSVE